jgi:hypothetical protein
MAVKDTDKDGIPDSIDANPNVPNSNQAGNYPSFTPNFPGIQLPGVNGYVSEEVAKSWFTFSKTRTGLEKKTYDGFIADLAAKGISKKKAQAVWNDAVAWTQTLGSTSGRPLDYLAVMDPSDYTGGSESEYGTKRQTQKQVTEYSKSGASQQIRDTMKQELGREATAEETALYTKAVNAAAKKEPSKYTGVTTTTPGGSSTTSTQSTGFDPTLFAQNFARSIPNYAETFAAKDFVSLIDQVLTDPNRIGQVVE